MRLVGIDQSARGTAAVCLDNGRLRDMLFWCDSKGDFKKHKALPGIRFHEAVTAGDEHGKTDRLSQIASDLTKFIVENAPTYAAFENYAMARQAFAHSLGEVGAVTRLALWNANIPYRVYDIQAIKIFACNNGAAEKAEVIMACRDQWERINFLDYGKASGAAGNLADAYVIAQMLHLEIEIRAGNVKLEELTEQQRRVMLRTTKQNPTNVLSQPFASLAG